ncbi:MAG: 3-oxoacyl-[acyl-carrier-protein] reductase FabG [Chlamydiales bacterium]|nr:3-oxoacyl-[acyl-carrier-protein] reductase FabG [Chlamydiales bacterium]MCH9619207.1 3-oxoacyl-[acyl-carrier-protein] reductase FabG [Chlamydiales bacterium]MCH9622469.1 3-oxoacyl-[acyl-carrier-protein] reductase FabG [Chlamydiales bacterium]
MGQLEGKVAVVTGGNSGIGQAIAKKFDAEGAHVFIFGRNEKTLDETVDQLKNGSGFVGDVRNLSDLEMLFKNVGKFDILVANAGIASRVPLDQTDEALFDEIVETNYKGLYFTVRYALPFLNKGGNVLLMSSIAAHRGVEEMSLYCSTKAATSSLAKSFAADLVGRDIRVNALSPGYIMTPIFDPLPKTDPEFIKEREERVPMKRFGTPEEIAEAASFLCGPNASYITGSDLLIDGGLLNCITTKT